MLDNHSSAQCPCTEETILSVNGKHKKINKQSLKQCIAYRIATRVILVSIKSSIPFRSARVIQNY